MIRSSAPAVHHQVAQHRERPRAPRLDEDHVAVPEAPHVELAGGGARIGPWATPLIMRPHEPQIPSRQSWSNAIGSSPASISRSLTHVEHLEERHVGADVPASYSTIRPGVGRRLTPDVQREVHL